MLIHQVGDVLDEFCLVDAIGYFADDNLVVLFARLNLGPGAHDDASSSGLVGVAHALHTINEGTRWEVGSWDVLHQSCHVDVGVVDVGYAAVDALTEVVGWDVRGHTYGDTRGTIDEQVGEQRGQHAGFLLLAVEVVHHVHRLFLQVLHHGFSGGAEACLGVTHGSR